MLNKDRNLTSGDKTKIRKRDLKEKARQETKKQKGLMTNKRSNMMF